MRQALERLCVCTASSGFGASAAAVAAGPLRSPVDEVPVGHVGNVLGMRRCGREGAPRLLLNAHLDEIDLLVTGIEDGFLHLRSIGDVDPRMLPGQELVVLADPPRRGIATCSAGRGVGKSIPLSELFVDVDLSQTETERVVPVGTPMVYRGGYFTLGEDRMRGKSMDNRSCFITLLRATELLRDRELNVDLYLLSFTREEVSRAGVTVGVWAVQPSFCVAVDVTHSKTPDDLADKTFIIGGGPAIDVDPNMTRWMINRMLARAKEGQIPYQLGVMSGHTGINGWEVRINQKGIATSVLSLSLRCMHSPIEALSLVDTEQVAALLVALTGGLGKEAAWR